MNTQPPDSTNTVWHPAPTRRRLDVQNNCSGARISPYRADRERVRGMVEHGDFIEIFCDSPLEICESRDVKGLYKTSQRRVSRNCQKARAGEIKDFTGISSPYEAPAKAELTIKTGAEELDTCVQQVIGEMLQRGIIYTHP